MESLETINICSTLLPESSKMVYLLYAKDFCSNEQNVDAYIIHIATLSNFTNIVLPESCILKHCKFEVLITVC